MNRYVLSARERSTRCSGRRQQCTGRWRTARVKSTAPAKTVTNFRTDANMALLAPLRAAEACELDVDGYQTGLVKGSRIKFSERFSERYGRRGFLLFENAQISRILIVKKPGTQDATAALRDIATWLTERGLEVLVEAAVAAAEAPGLTAFRPGADSVDLCISLGGDGTVLHLVGLFGADEPLPPVISFAMGSLGFLTPFDVKNFAPTLTRVLAAVEGGPSGGSSAPPPLWVSLRTRKRCDVVDKHGAVTKVHHVFNDCVIDRGSNPAALCLECFIDGSCVTTVQADGLIISTPSGSTAYSMSAGGPIIAPSVPCTILTPLSPLSLSFRPIVIPEYSDLTLTVAPYSRASGRASFDGRAAVKIPRGASIRFTTSLYPVPVINLAANDHDWYDGIVSKLKWNQPIRQIPAAAAPGCGRGCDGDNDAVLGPLAAQASMIEVMTMESSGDESDDSSGPTPPPPSGPRNTGAAAGSSGANGNGAGLHQQQSLGSHALD